MTILKKKLIYIPYYFEGDLDCIGLIYEEIGIALD